jgi:Aldehyde dehydrogenase family
MNPHTAAETFESHDPRTGEVLNRYHEASDDAIAQACAQAAGAVADLRDDRARVHLLREAARRLRAAASSLHAVCERETGLPHARLESELERTCVQLELFAAVFEDGGYVEAIIDTANPDAQPEELDGLHELVRRMETLAGRVIFDGFPPGVAVTHAMHHGGPYPATSAPSHTSVGSTATLRFQRPVVWQNAPAAVLPAALQDDNPLGIWRLVNGTLTRDPLSSTAG